MNIERAREIQDALVRHTMISHGLDELGDLPDISGFELADMLEADRLMRADEDYQGMYIDPRGLAALYVWAHYQAEPNDGSQVEPVLLAGGKAVVVLEVPA